jgi:hypothetical protein
MILPDFPVSMDQDNPFTLRVHTLRKISFDFVSISGNDHLLKRTLIRLKTEGTTTTPIPRINSTTYRNNVTTQATVAD